LVFLAAIASAYSFSRSAVAAANKWSIELEPESDAPDPNNPSGPTYPYNLYGIFILYFLLSVKSLK